VAVPANTVITIKAGAPYLHLFVPTFSPEATKTPFRERQIQNAAPHCACTSDRERSSRTRSTPTNNLYRFSAIGALLTQVSVTLIRRDVTTSLLNVFRFD